MSADVIATLLHHVGRGLSTLLDVVQSRSLWALRWIRQVPPLLTPHDEVRREDCYLLCPYENRAVESNELDVLSRSSDGFGTKTGALLAERIQNHTASIAVIGQGYECGRCPCHQDLNRLANPRG